MIRKLFLAVLLATSFFAVSYGAFFRTFVIHDNLDKFDQLKDIGISIKIPGYEQQPSSEFKAQSEVFTEPQVVKATTFEGVGVYKDGRLMSNYPDLRMLRDRRPCPT